MLFELFTNSRHVTFFFLSVNKSCKIVSSKFFSELILESKLNNLILFLLPCFCRRIYTVRMNPQDVQVMFGLTSFISQFDHVFSYLFDLIVFAFQFDSEF